MVEKATVVIVGSGVIGMTTALCLSKAGYRSIVVSKDQLCQTTSSAAAAFWYPYRAEPKQRVSTWAKKSLSVFRELERIPEAGIVWHEFSELLLPQSDLPWWHETIDNFRCDDHPTKLPIGQRKTCHYSVPIIDTGFYLEYLRQSLKAVNVEFLTAELSRIDEAFEVGNIVVNCSGIGAISLVDDHDLHPARGQVVKIKRQPNHVPVLDVSQEPLFAHVIPRINDTVLGGTYEENVSSLEPDKNETIAIIERCKSILPALGNISDTDILGVSCGLRPVRSSVRLEQEQFRNKWLFHNYGHGGAGFTLSWGCAEEICKLIQTKCPL